MRDIIEEKKKFADYEFSIIILTSVPDQPEVNKKDIPQDERLQHKNLTEMLVNDTIPGILNNATNENYELIIVDNGSSKQHKEILFNISHLHKPMRLVFNNENFGVAPGWNSGLKIARGKYICIVSDDYIIKTPNFLKLLQQPMLDDEKVVITSPETTQIGLDGMSRSLWNAPYADSTSVNCVMIRKSFFENHGYLDDYFWPYLMEDTELGIRANSFGYKIMRIDLPESMHWGSSTVYRYWTNQEIDEIFRLNKKYMLKKHQQYLLDRILKDERYK